jgi:CheY-like chemotaxis protein
MPPFTALVVDDSMLIRHTVCQYLERRGGLVESATNGQEALTMLEHIHPDLLITDLDMPKMSGDELIKTLKAHPVLKNLPVIILCGRQSGETLHSTEGADFVLYKSIDLEVQLGDALDAILDRRNQQQDPGSAQG